MRKSIVCAAVIACSLMTSCNYNPANVGNGGDQPSIHSIRIAAATTASDYSASNFEIVSAEDHAAASNLISRLHTDHSIRAFGGSVYILERHGRDNVIKYDPRGMAIEYQQNLGSGLNLQDIAVVSETKSYISALNSDELIVFDPSSGAKLSSIDLSRFNSYVGSDSAEASPFAGALAVSGSRLYIACQRLKTVQEVWGPNIVAGDTSLIVIVDTETDEVIGSIRLNRRNPASMSIRDGLMLVSSQGSWDDIGSGGVELVDLSENINLGVIADGRDLGGNPSDVVFVNPRKAYVCVMTESFSTAVVPFDPSSGTIGAPVGGIGDGFGGLVHDGSMVYAGDRGLGGAGIAVINTETNTVERKIATGMPPSSLAIIFAN